MATDTDSFIQEVSEELRRDRMYRVWRRYGPWFLAALALFVAWFAWAEWTKAQDRRAAEARGAAFSEAVALPPGAQRVAALEALAQQGGSAAPLVMMRAGGLLLDEGDAKGAASSYAAAAGSAQLPAAWKDLAQLRALMAEADARAPAELLAELEPLTAEGHVWRDFARELKAMVQIRADDLTGALATLDALAATENLPGGLSTRVSAMRRALGAPPLPASTPAPAP